MVNQKSLTGWNSLSTHLYPCCNAVVLPWHVPVVAAVASCNDHVRCSGEKYVELYRLSGQKHLIEYNHFAMSRLKRKLAHIFSAFLAVIVPYFIAGRFESRLSCSFVKCVIHHKMWDAFSQFLASVHTNPMFLVAEDKDFLPLIRDCVDFCRQRFIVFVWTAENLAFKSDSVRSSKC